jgi:hypothetical protein
MACKRWQEGFTDAPSAAFSSDGLLQALVFRETRHTAGIGIGIGGRPAGTSTREGRGHTSRPHRAEGHYT